MTLFDPKTLPIFFVFLADPCFMKSSIKEEVNRFETLFVGDSSLIPYIGLETMNQTETLPLLLLLLLDFVVNISPKCSACRHE